MTKFTEMFVIILWEYDTNLNIPLPCESVLIAIIYSARSRVVLTSLSGLGMNVMLCK